MKKPKEIEIYRPGYLNEDEEFDNYIKLYLEQEYNHKVESFMFEFDMKKIYITQIKWHKAEEEK